MIETMNSIIRHVCRNVKCWSNLKAGLEAYPTMPRSHTIIDQQPAATKCLNRNAKSAYFNVSRNIQDLAYVEDIVVVIRKYMQ